MHTRVPYTVTDLHTVLMTDGDNDYNEAIEGRLSVAPLIGGPGRPKPTAGKGIFVARLRSGNDTTATTRFRVTVERLESEEEA